ncbi:phosphatidylglycerophosphatase A [Mailhella sp.]|uniref:phosphatidylglycerophosphatase A family protein n=1 Tax=Mailhella sp. TaxID=1981029 RepID=UPI003AB1892E
MTSFDTIVLHFCRLGPAGHSPKAPGTAGSFLATLLAPFLFLPLSLPWRLTLLLILFLVGGFAASRAEVLLQRQDPGCVVIDELVGQWIAMLGLGSFSSASTWRDVVLLLVVFLFFRFFDILKPWPVHASESWLPAGWGIMIDDVLAGVWALLCVSVVMVIANIVFPGSLTL